LLTPPGTAGIAVIQIRGPEALAVLREMFRSRRFPTESIPDDNRLYLGQVFDRKEPIDDVIVWCGRGQNDWIVEIQCHGGLRVVERVLHRATSLGAEAVERGDEPADDVTAGNTSLEREIYEALPKAETRAVACWLLGQAWALPIYICQVIESLQQYDLAAAQARLKTLTERNQAGSVLLKGARITLVGAPNAGKSTLANRLVRQQGSLISASPGTTRDWVSHPASMQGVPVAVIDTAGLREPADPIEAESITRGLDQAEAADVVIWLADRSCPWPRGIAERINQVGPGTIRILAANKSDLPAAWSLDTIATDKALASLTVVPISALTGQGVPDLEAAILEQLGLSRWDADWAALWTDRQRALSRQALQILSDAPPKAARILADIIS
jgi:tRNA modification GTPase